MTRLQYPVLLHGFAGSSADWGDPLVDGLTSSGCLPVLVDLPGHGRLSEARGIDLESTLAHLQDSGAWPDALLGYSMGGRIALHFAATYPELVNKLVLESASPGLASDTERSARAFADDALAERILTDGLEAFVEEWARLPLFESQERLDANVRARQRELRLMNRPEGLAGALRGLGTGRLPSLWDRLPSVEMPTLLLVGSLDPKFLEINLEMERLMPNARLVAVPDAGHNVHLERPAAWLDAVTSFLSA